MTTAMTIASLLHIGFAGLMFNTLLNRNESSPFLKCWFWMFLCAPHVSAEIKRLRGKL